MPGLVWVVVGLALIMGSWLAFDGGRALLLGDYITPKSGDYAGQLGPWAKVVSAAGLDPRSTLMKSVHLVLGLAWLVAAIGFAMQLPWAWPVMLGCAVLTLWYLPFGTIVSIVQIILLFLPALRDLEN